MELGGGRALPTINTSGTRSAGTGRAYTGRVATIIRLMASMSFAGVKGFVTFSLRLSEEGSNRRWILSRAARSTDHFLSPNRDENR